MSMSDKPRDPCFVDTNIWLYAFIEGSEPEKSIGARNLIAAYQPVLSVQVVNEICVNLIKRAGCTEHQIRQLVSAFNEKYRVVDIDLDILATASRLREQHVLSYWGSMTIACAIHAGVGILYSDNLQHELVIDRNLRIINPFRG